ncbi:YceK/YidQ family lipoprotein [Pseudomonas sp. MH10]|nr:MULTISPECIES: YceK/YidQ family lipoprotein [unclassified Pseudomonas]MEB0122916.1 YceK/YidQ family lipoprotein [Pseudomonas sp. CCI1.2]MEB0043723.1 YceK/YidQ family lipoprotein [Pseudomonas sp. MH10]MEB0094393.1 YceK/YidQ family lipoprotein [Pseudomonas sp. CCI4.2]WPX55200.1 YceK/YidQ family lipoprotein [Pseudomonas sp. CCI4.2]WPX62644.1 YceK/YidQ family lipoprotein [Pseudomonas sp. MH10]
MTNIFKKANHIVKTTLILFLLLSTNGCGTLAGRAQYDDPDAYFFKSLQGSYEFLTGGFARGYDPSHYICWMSIICPVAFVYSLPVDAAVDTILLPYDLYNQFK